MLVIKSLCWRLFSLWWWCFQFIKTVINILDLSPTLFVANIRQQHDVTILFIRISGKLIKNLPETIKSKVCLRARLISSIWSFEFFLGDSNVQDVLYYWTWFIMNLLQKNFPNMELISCFFTIKAFISPLGCNFLQISPNFIWTTKTIWTWYLKS